MKKHMILAAMAFLAFTRGNAQWENKISDNGFDPVFRYSVCDAKGNPNVWIKIEKATDSTVLFLIFTGYVCDEDPTVDLSFKTDTGYVKKAVEGVVDKPKKRIYIGYININRDAGNVWRNSTILRIRVNDGHCGTQIYTFDMTLSASALKWVIN